jgi:hypothetical protein
MIKRWPKFVAVLLAVMFTGAAHACMCAGMGEKAPAPVSADPHACCKTEGENTPAPASEEDPCEKCNAQHPLTITVPEKSATAPAPDFSMVAPSAIDLQLVQSLVGLPAYPATDDVPVPPLLRDLVHTSCQLTV